MRKPTTSLQILSLGALCSLALVTQQADAALLYGLDSENGTSFNEFDGQGVKITDAATTSNWISGPASTINGGGTVSLTGLTGVNGTGSDDITVKVDLTGTHNVIFEKFAFAMQRGGGGGSNIISNALYSTDGVNFFAATVQEVAVGGNGGGSNVGPADTITDFRVPNGLGGTIGPQQVYVVSGLDAAGTLNSDSFFVRFTLGSSTNDSATATFLTDRNDLTTDAMALAANNTVPADDGFDIAWYGTSTLVPEPSSAALLGLGGLALILRRRKA
ncbi:PEP-CTERM sorting domain-containing protein [Oceaniferula spumae]